MNSSLLLLVFFFLAIFAVSSIECGGEPDIGGIFSGVSGLLGSIGGLAGAAGNCTPSSLQRTFFFAYSTDIDPQAFSDIFYGLKHYAFWFPYAFYATVRMDMKQPDNIQYNSIWNTVNSSVYSHWPNASLGYSDLNTGSDVLNVIEKFLDNTQLPVCGSVIHIYLKRYPNELDIDNLVERIRQSNSVVAVVIPSNPSGGLYPQTMYNLATKTNGLGFFEDQSEYNADEYDMNWWEFYPYLTYSTNVNVAGNGSVTLPPMSRTPSWAHIYITVQDSGIVSTFQNMSLTFQGSTETYTLTPENGVYTTNNNFVRGSHTFTDTNYSVTFNYEYSDAKQQTLQIRVLTEMQVKKVFDRNNYSLSVQSTTGFHTPTEV